MCQPTPALKFCTCDIGDDDSAPDNYWILYTPKGDDFLPTTIGSIVSIVTDEIKEETYAAFTLASLNNENCFDVHLNIMEGDVLEILMRTPSDFFNFYLEYKSGMWQRCADMDLLSLGNLYNKVSEGITRPEIFEHFKNRMLS